MMVGVKRKAGRLPNGAIKIGTVARQFGISVDLLRLYEREGLLIPLKSPRGTRYYTEHDFAWIGTILRLVRQARLNLASIRRLLALLPCWQLRNCPYDRRLDCPVMHDATQPCWVNRGHCQQLDPRECYFCVVYRSAPSCENMKALLSGNGDAAGRTPQPQAS